MSRRSTRRLAVGAALAASTLAGTNVNGLLITLPAWQRTGAAAWAAFSDYADRGPAGRVLYPLEAFGALLLSIATLVSFHRGGAAPPAARVPLWGAVVLAAGGLLATARAAPSMLGVPRRRGDPAALQQALDGFQHWSNVRGVFQVLAFVANLWSVVALSAAAEAPDREAAARRPDTGARSC
jgi:hypothetical protein